MELSFYKKKQRWYVDLPESNIEEPKREMILGADILCEELSKGKKTLTVKLSLAKRKSYLEIKKKRISFKNFYGRVYNVDGMDLSIWLCPVTKYVFGKYPKSIFIKKIS